MIWSISAPARTSVRRVDINPDSFHVLSIAGSYWKGDEHNQQLQRIYGTAFLTAEELSAYLKQLEEAKKRDHRKLGRELDLFSISEEAGPGLVFWHPKGTRVRIMIEDFLRKELIPARIRIRDHAAHSARSRSGRTSGHYDYYRQNMYVFEDRRGGVRHQADELSGAYPDLQVEDAQLSRPAAALRGVRHGLPLRKERRAARTSSRARIYAG